MWQCTYNGVMCDRGDDELTGQAYLEGPLRIADHAREGAADPIEVEHGERVHGVVSLIAFEVGFFVVTAPDDDVAQLQDLQAREEGGVKPEGRTGECLGVRDDEAANAIEIVWRNGYRCI